MPASRHGVTAASLSNISTARLRRLEAKRRGPPRPGRRRRPTVGPVGPYACADAPLAWSMNRPTGYGQGKSYPARSSSSTGRSAANALSHAASS